MCCTSVGHINYCLTEAKTIKKYFIETAGNVAVNT